MPRTPDALLDEFRRAGALLEGHFLLSSGLHSPTYLQCALVLQDPKLASRLCRRLAREMKGTEADLVIGPALGAILVAYELARALGVRGLFTERVDGRMALRRGFAIRPGERAILVEDVITTGTSLAEVAEVVRACGAQVAAVACLVDRTSGRDPGLGLAPRALLKLDIPTYPADACPLCARGVPVVKPGSRTGPLPKEPTP
jgi:orotate phosphoribosyltransferase